MRMSSNLTDTVAQNAIPAAVYTGHVTKMERDPKPGKSYNVRVLTWEVDEGEFRGREIKYDQIFTGGMTKTNTPMPLFRLIQFIDCANIPWSCVECSSPERIAHFIIGTGTNTDAGENGLERGKFHCPDCRQPCRVNYDDDNFMGARCKLDVIQETQPGKDRPNNKIKQYLPLV